MLGDALGAVVTRELLVFAAGALFVSLLVMWTLRRSAGLPMRISVLVVPVVVATGFGAAVLVHAALDVSMLLAGGTLATTLFPLAYVYERRFGEPV